MPVWNVGFRRALRKLFLSTLLGLPLVFVHAKDLGAQSTNRPTASRTSFCATGLVGGGPECAPDRRLLIDVRWHGTGATQEVERAVDLASSAAGFFRLTPQQALTTDSSIYAILDVDRDSSGAYRIETSIAGLHSRNSRNCEGHSTGILPDLEFGAYLAMTTSQLVRCAEGMRAALEPDETSTVCSGRGRGRP